MNTSTPCTSGSFLFKSLGPPRSRVAAQVSPSSLLSRLFASFHSHRKYQVAVSGCSSNPKAAQSNNSLNRNRCDHSKIAGGGRGLLFAVRCRMACSWAQWALSARRAAVENTQCGTVTPAVTFCERGSGLSSCGLGCFATSYRVQAPQCPVNGCWEEAASERRAVAVLWASCQTNVIKVGLQG